MAIRSAQAKPARALSHHNSGQMSALLNPTHGMRDEMRRAGLAPKNHQSANIRRIRELEATNREKRSVAEGKSADVWSPETKNQKYAHVTSTVARELAHKPSPRARPATAPAPTSGPRTPSGFTVGRVRDPKPIYLSTPMAEVEIPKTRKPAVPRRSDAPATPRAREEPKDFVHSNIKRAATPTPRPSTAGSARAAGPFRSPEQAVRAPDAKAHHASYGALPKYLVERKLEMALARDRKEREAEERKFCPPGTRLLAESERLATLDKMRKANDEVLAQLRAQPLNPHTLSQKRAKAELEAKAKGIADALTIFGRSRVVVQDE